MKNNPDAEIIGKIIEFIDNHDSFVISGHVGADGDAIAACLAMAELLDQRGKKFDLVFHDEEQDRRFRHLKWFDRIMPASQVENPSWDAAILCDTPGFARLGDTADLIKEADCALLRIDHHPAEGEFDGLVWEGLGRSSATILIYHLLNGAGVSWSRELAEIVISGIVYDTGRFAYRNTHEEDMLAAAQMIGLGAKIENISQIIFFNYKLNSLKVLGTGLSNAKNYLDGRLTIISLNYQEMDSVSSSEVEDLANYSAAVEGGLAGAFIREVEPGYFRISLRSRSRVKVDGVARKFGGGGHPQAAGCRMEGITMEEVIGALLSEFKIVFEEFENSIS